MILDPYMIKGIEGITSDQIFNSFAKLYIDVNPSKTEYLPSIDKWLVKLRKVPGTALSTGGRNSLRGVLTCSLLDVLEVKNPRAARNRYQLAWAILESNHAIKSIGHVSELEEARAKKRMPRIAFNQ